MFTDSSLRISYRTNDKETLLSAFEEQGTFSVKTRNVIGPAQDQPRPVNAADALAWAKSRARETGRGSNIVRPARRVSEMEIGESREFEMFWWPSLYTKSNYGKLTLRLFVQKTGL